MSCFASHLSEYNEWLKFFSSLIALFIILWGIKLVNDLRLRGVDAICGFHAKLKVNLKILKKKSHIDCDISKNDCDELIEYKTAAASVFLCLSTDKTNRDLRTEIDKLTKSVVVYYGENDLKKFMFYVLSTINLLKDSTGQIPLSKKMYDDLDTLSMTLLDIIENQERYTPLPKDYTMPRGYLLDSHRDVVDKCKDFDTLIDDIIEEIDTKTERLLMPLWKRLSKEA